MARIHGTLAACARRPPVAPRALHLAQPAAMALLAASVAPPRSPACCATRRFEPVKKNMSQFRIREIRINNFRCFGEVRLPLEEDTTVVFAENGGGKTALLTALAIGLAAFQCGSPTSPRLDARRDPRMLTLDGKGRRRPIGPCKLAWTAAVGESGSVTWSMKADPASGRSTTNSQPILDALERIRVPGSRWPLFAWYGVDRFARSRSQRERVERTPSRWEAYASALAPQL